MAFGMIFVILLLLIFVCLITYLLIRKTNKTSMEIMVLGLAIMLLGGIFAVDPNSNLGGIEYIIVFIGLGITVAGFAKNSPQA